MSWALKKDVKNRSRDPRCKDWHSQGGGGGLNSRCHRAREQGQARAADSSGGAGREVLEHQAKEAPSWVSATERGFEEMRLWAGLLHWREPEREGMGFPEAASGPERQCGRQENPHGKI